MVKFWEILAVFQIVINWIYKENIFVLTKANF